MNITRYDGTRFITEEEIDREFTGHWVLVSTKEDVDREGYLIASAEGRDELRPALEEIGILELHSEGTIIYGCKERGGSLHVELLG
ncbi:MAG: hypothetical protein FWF81_11565 [Defluviitaleaceae bacterium]|nr:hypothetical protein [Defluviitaleaceae bacterium]